MRALALEAINNWHAPCLFSSVHVRKRMATKALTKKVWLSSAKAAILPLATLMLVGLMIVPVPSFVLDIGFITNILISLAVLMIALNAEKPLDFSAFPTVLLFATLFRLGLNVASTRVVLVHGHEGE